MSRPFRRSLLVRAEAKVARHPLPERLRDLHVQSNTRPAAAGDEDATGTHQSEDGAAQFITREGNRVSTNNPLMKSLIGILSGAWPRAIPFRELSSHIDPDVIAAAGEGGIAPTVLECYLAGLLDLRLSVPSFASGVSDRPQAWRLARVQAAAGLERITTPLHLTVTIDDFLRHLLPRLDGTRTRPALVDEMVAFLSAGDVGLTFEGSPVTDPAQIRNFAAESLPLLLDKLVTVGLLVS